MREVKVLIAGRSGQLAQALIRAMPPMVNASALGRASMDMLNPQSVKDTVRSMAPAIVINTAAYTAVDAAESDEAAAYTLNADAAGHLAKAASEAGAPIIHVSTDYVFDGETSRPYTEADPVLPLNVYGWSKLAGERQVVEGNARHVILRTSSVYSSIGRNFVKTMLALAERRDEIPVVDDQFGSPTSAVDIAQGIWDISAQILQSSDARKTGLFHMTAGGEATWADFAEAVFRFSRERGGPYAAVRPITSAEYPVAAARPKNSRLDSTRLKQAYGVTLPDWRESAEQVVAELITTRGWRE